MSLYRAWGKRAIDVIGASGALVLGAPLLGLLALCVRVVHGPPVFFAQARPGLHGRPFRMIKFRTMTNERDELGALLSDMRRTTKLGAAMRALSLDELPELFNVVRGDMSLVGPRPLLMEYLPRYTATQARRHEVRPGITGLAQISGRNAIDWAERLAWDVEYVRHFDLAMDVRILGATLRAVSRRTGINANENETMSLFQGAPDRLIPRERVATSQ